MKSVFRLEEKRMSVRGKYHSKNYDEILNYLKSIPGKHITINDIYRELSGQGSSVGTTTIYRHLNRMVEEGLVNKYTIEPNMPACYEFIRMAGPEEISNSYHCICEVCGKLIHLHCGELEELQRHLLKEHSFRLNPLRTVIYGVCEACLSEHEPKKIHYQERKRSED